ncbi:hypothetical protein MC885_016703 [Smutsia gigantea]|nr:hypothetical protein MC885_016703 [Smutsia gigantea]
MARVREPVARTVETAQRTTTTAVQSRPAQEQQIRKEAEKTAVTKVVVATDKTKEQELKLRTREVITTEEQVHVTHEQIRKETEKAFMPKVVISTAKAKEETRTTGEITTKQEQKQISQETVSPTL